MVMQLYTGTSRVRGWATVGSTLIGAGVERCVAARRYLIYHSSCTDRWPGGTGFLARNDVRPFIGLRKSSQCQVCVASAPQSNWASQEGALRWKTSKRRGGGGAAHACASEGRRHGSSCNNKHLRTCCGGRNTRFLRLTVVWEVGGLRDCPLSRSLHPLVRGEDYGAYW